MSESTHAASPAPAPASRPASPVTPGVAPPVAASTTAAGPPGGNGVAARAGRAGEAGPARVAADHARITAHREGTTARVAGLLGSPELAPFRTGLQGLGYRSPGRATRAVKEIFARGEPTSEAQHALVRLVGLEYVLYLLYSLDRERVAHADLLGKTESEPGAGETSSVKRLAYRAAGLVGRGLEYAYRQAAETLGRSGPVPPYAIWDGIEEEIEALERAVDSRSPGAEDAPDLRDVTARVRKILALLLPRQQQIGDYLAATVVGGQRTVTTLQVLEGLTDLGLLLLTGGLASGLKAGAKVGVRKALAEGAKYTAENLGKGALLSGATTGALRLVKGTAREVTLSWLGLQDDVPLTRVIVDAGADAAVAVVGALAGGYLSRSFLRAFESSLSSRLTPRQLASLQIPAGLFVGALTAPLMAAVTTAIDAIRGNEQRPQNVREFIDLVVQYLWQGALLQGVLTAVLHTPTSRAASAATTEPPPARPLPATAEASASAPSAPAEPVAAASRTAPPGNSGPTGEGAVRVAYAPDVEVDVLAREIVQRAEETQRPHFLYLSSKLTPGGQSLRIVVFPGDPVTAVVEKLLNLTVTRTLPKHSVGGGLVRVGTPVAPGEPLKGTQRFEIEPGARYSVALERALQVAQETGATQRIGNIVLARGEERSFGGVRARETVQHYRQDIEVRPGDQLSELTQRLARAEARRAGKAELQHDQHLIDEAAEPGRVLAAERERRLQAVFDKARASGERQQVVVRATDRTGKEVLRPVLEISGQGSPEGLAQRYLEQVARLDRARPQSGQRLIDEAMRPGERIVEERERLLAKALVDARNDGPVSIVVRRTNRHGETYLHKLFDVHGTEELAQVKARYLEAVAELREPPLQPNQHAIEDHVLAGEDVEVRTREELGKVLARARASGPQKVVVRVKKGSRTLVEPLFEVGPSDTLDGVVKTYQERRFGPAASAPHEHRIEEVFLPGTERSAQLQRVLDRANATRETQTIVRPVQEPIGLRYEEVTRVRPGESLADVRQRVDEATTRYRIIDSRPRPRRGPAGAAGPSGAVDDVSRHPPLVTPRSPQTPRPSSISSVPDPISDQPTRPVPVPVDSREPPAHGPATDTISDQPTAPFPIPPDPHGRTAIAVDPTVDPLEHTAEVPRFETIDPKNRQPGVLRLTDQRTGNSVRTEIVGPRGTAGTVEAAYDSASGELTLLSVEFDRDLPRILTGGRTHGPGAGASTHAYLVLRILKQLDPSFRPGALRGVTLSEVLHLGTVLEHHTGTPLRSTRLGTLADEVITLTGGKITGATITRPGEIKPLSVLIDRWRTMGNAYPPELLSRLLREFSNHGITLQTHVRFNFDVHFSVASAR